MRERGGTDDDVSADLVSSGGGIRRHTRGGGGGAADGPPYQHRAARRHLYAMRDPHEQQGTKKWRGLVGLLRDGTVALQCATILFSRGEAESEV